MSNPREIWFIRHGESVANAGGRTVEAATYPLSEVGMRQAEQIAPQLPEPDLIIYSTYFRARQTAEPTMRRFTAVPTEEWPVQEVQFLDPIRCVGTTQDERGAMAADYWRLLDPEISTPGAESFIGFIKRVRDALDLLATRSERRVLVFSHGYFMKAIVWLIEEKPTMIDSDAMASFWKFVHVMSVPNCAILRLRVEGGVYQSEPVFLPHGVEQGTPPKVPVQFTGL